MSPGARSRVWRQTFVSHATSCTLRVSGKPGLGIDVDEMLAARYPYPEHPLNGTWSPVGLRDSTVQRP